MARILALVGKPAVGKTRLADELQALLGWQRLSIDTEREQGGDWPSLVAKLEHTRAPTIVESVAMPRPYRRALANQRATVVLVQCEEDERLARLTCRGEERVPARAYANRMAARRVDRTRPDGGQARRLVAEIVPATGMIAAAVKGPEGPEKSPGGG
jgi:adenylate kinase family enzyme